MNITKKINMTNSNSHTLRDADLNGKKVFIRADLNVPLDDAGNITDLHRIKEFIPTLRLIIEKGGIPINCVIVHPQLLSVDHGHA